MSTYFGIVNGVARDATEEEILQIEKDRFAEKIKAPIRFREQRNMLLAETDWTQAADVPQSIKDKWVPYRQALRDVPQQAGFPETVVWPVKP